MSKATGNSGCAAIAIIAIMGAIGYYAYQKQQAPEKLRHADELFASGKQKEAIAIYESTYSYLDDGREPLRRIVEYHVAQNELKDAEAWILKGVKSELAVTYSSATAQDIAARLKRERDDQKRNEVERQQAANERRQREASRPSKVDAIVEAHEYVQKFLKYPLDASFPWLGPETVESNEDGTYWSIIATIKAKNAFGATLTLPWKVTLTHEHGNWELVYCEIDGEAVFLNDDLAKAVVAIATASSSTDAPPDPAAELRAKDKDWQEKKKAAQAAVYQQQRAAASRNGPAIAANHLRLAKDFLQQGQKDAGERMLRRIVNEYPETEAAKEAKRLLDK